MLIGASPANTNGSGHCMIATPTNAAIAMSGAQSHRLRNNGAAILATTAINRPVAAAVMPARMRPSISRSPNCAYRNASTVTMMSGGPISPASATAAPGAPPKRDPNTTEKFTTFGPGRNCDSANASLNSSAVIHRRCSTIIRRAQGSAPPNPEIDTTTKARNNANSEGRATDDDCGTAGVDIAVELYIA